MTLEIFLLVFLVLVASLIRAYLKQTNRSNQMIMKLLELDLREKGVLTDDKISALNRERNILSLTRFGEVVRTWRKGGTFVWPSSR